MRLRSANFLPALAAIHTGVWAVGLASFPGTYTVRFALAQYLSTFVLVVVSTNLLLATRSRAVESSFGGLDKVFASHRTDGVVAASVIVAHVAIVPITVPLLQGRLLGIIGFALVELSVIFAIAPRTPLRGLLEVPYQWWKGEHRFMGVFVAIVAAHSLIVPTMVRYMPVVRFWVYGMVALGLLAYVYRQTVFRIVARRHRYSVAETRTPGAGVLEVHLEPQLAPIAFKPGQFAFVRFDAGPSREMHPFTLSAPPAGGPLRFSIKDSGDYTDALPDSPLGGSTARIEGPYGRFDFTRGRARQVWIAGGIGITPFLAFLPSVGAEYDVTLVWTVHSAAEGICAEEIEPTVAEKPNVRFELWPSAEKGHLSLDALGIEEPAEVSYYLCGPVVMRDALLGQLDAAGVKRRDVHYEEFSLR